MVSESRSARIADMIKRDIALLFLQEISDPRLAGINVTSVEVDREVSYADIYISAIDGDERKTEIMAALQRAGGFIRSELAHSISHLRTFPQIRFFWDPIPARVDRIDQILAELDEEEGIINSDE
ncbi:MAG: 30S ribosome-binding factor RbfA [Anaerolineales bacterium]